jgi:hypothetical protein
VAPARADAEQIVRCRYAAYGIELDCDFALPAWGIAGARPAPGRRIAATAVEPAELTALWSGSYRRLHAATVGDGMALTVDRGREGDHLIAHGEHRFHLSADGARLGCALEEADPRRWHALLDWAAYATAVLTGGQCLHAAAVRVPGVGLVAIAAPPEAGKTTLAAELIAAGCEFFSDDVLALGVRDGRVIGHPGPPFAGLALTVPAARPELVGAVILLDRRPDGPPRPRFAAQGVMALRAHVAGFDGGGEAERFALLAALAEQAPPLRLEASDAVPAAVLAAAVRATLAERAGR